MKQASVEDEQLLLLLLRDADPHQIAILLQSFIAEKGLLTEATAAEVRELLAHDRS